MAGATGGLIAIGVTLSRLCTVLTWLHAICTKALPRPTEPLLAVIICTSSTIAVHAEIPAQKNQISQIQVTLPRFLEHPVVTDCQPRVVGLFVLRTWILAVLHLRWC